MIAPNTLDCPLRDFWLALLSVLVSAFAVSNAQAGEATETSGEVLRFALPAAAFALTFRNDDTEGRRQFYRSFGANVAATLVLKELVDKDRPDGSDNDAMPSGHTSMAFQGAAFIQRRYGLRSAWPAWILASYTGWTRLDADEHDEADVIAGAALGIASAMLVTRRMPGIEVALLSDGQIGVQFSGRF